MERIYFIEYRDKKILFLDNSNATEEESIKLVNDFHDLAIKSEPNSLLVLHNVSDSPGSQEAVNLWKEYAVEHSKYVKKTAMLGGGTLQKAIIISFKSFVITHGLKNLEAIFKTFEYNNILDAKNWLVWDN
jgi:hypothetical protein